MIFMKKEDIVVVVPIYRPDLSEKEHVSLGRCVEILSEYTIVVVKPESLNIDLVLSKYSLLKVESFPDEYFADLRAYNKMVLDESFYSRFLSYEYMLIYQLDAYVFKDELFFWANKGYDYIGAPWIPQEECFLAKSSRLRLRLNYYYYDLVGSENRKKLKYYNYQVGNGGLSLRKVSKMIEVIRYYSGKISLLLADEQPFYPEDIFLLIELTCRKCRLRKPSFKEALKFSMESNPEWAYNYNEKQLPFGCHAWFHKSYSAFWSQIINTSSTKANCLNVW